MTDSTVSEKFCPFCKETKPGSEFHKNKKLEDGLNNKCKACVKIYFAENKEKIKAKNNEWRERNREKIAIEKKAWRESNAETIRAQRKAHHERNKERINAAKRARRACPEVKAKEREYLVKWRSENGDLIRKVDNIRHHTKRKFDLRYCVSKRISGQMWKALRRGEGKRGRAWESLVGYTGKELEARLLETMPQGYTWADYLTGELHIDHIIPVSAHNFQSSDDIDFKRCWALSNLRLLPKLDNLRKKDKLYEPFQPSLIGI